MPTLQSKYMFLVGGQVIQLANMYSALKTYFEYDIYNLMDIVQFQAEGKISIRKEY